jgi:membrane-bound inhibitor of C-type lysozyme
MKKFLIFFVVVAVLAAGAYAMKNKDSMSGKKMADPRISATWDMMLGPWMSEEDSGWVRVYKDDSTLVDTHDSMAGVVESTATWSLFVSENAPEVEFQLNNKDVYVEQIEKDDSKIYFRVVSVTPDVFELVNMTKGGAMRFNRAPMGGEVSPTPLWTATFTCENDPHGFTASFPDSMKEVIIASEGEENVFPAVTSESGKKFEGTNWSFLFRGETVTVTDKMSKTTKTCTQPFSNENAPMNFGD